MQLKDKFQEYLEYLKFKGLCDKTINEHRRFLYGSLSHSISEIPVANLKITDTAKAQEAGRLHGQFGPQRSVSVFRCFLKFLHDSGIKLNFDYRDIQVPRMPHKYAEYLTEEEMEKIRERFKEPSNITELRTRALIEILYATGMRISETISLNKEDINWQTKEALIRNVKTGDIEKVYFTDYSLEWLKKYLTARKDGLSALFISGRGRLLSCSARNRLREYTRDLGINKHICHHLFRKTFATRLLHGGANIKDVQYLCRHKSERTTLAYYTAVNKEKAKVVHQQIMNKIT